MADSNWSVRIGTAVKDDIQKQLDAMPKKTVQVTPILNTKSIQTGLKEITTYNDNMGNVITTTSKFNKEGEKLSTTFSKVKSTVDTTSQTLQTASKHTKTLGQDFVETAGKVAKFGAITAIFGLVTRAIGEAVSSVKELDASLTELKKVSDLSGSGLEEYTDDAFKMARELSSTASNVTDATASFVQAGYSLGESQGLSKYAIMLQTIADKTMDTETATNFLTSTIKSMNMTVGDAEHLISAVNQVSNEYAITSNDLSENIGKVAGVANVAGVSYEQLIGLMTSAVSHGSTASKSANSFKTLFINLQQMNDSGTMPKLSKQFKEFGIEMTDSISGATKSAFDLLNELSVAYKNVSNSTDIDKQNKMKTLLEDIAGKHNINVLINSLEGFDIALSATETALNSTGSAQREFDKALDAIDKKAEGLKGAFQELVWGDGGLQGLIKGLLDAGTTVLKLTSDLGGLPIILMSILSITTLIKGQMITVGLIKLAKFIPTLITSLNGLQIMYNSATKSIILSNQAINLSIPIIGLVVTAITALTMAWNSYSASQEEAKNSALESLSAFESQNKSISQSIQNIKNESATKESLISIISSLNKSYDEEKASLEDINTLRQESIDLLYKEAKAKAQETVRETGSEYEKQKGFLGKETTPSSLGISGTEADYGIIGTPEEKLKIAGEYIDAYNEKIDNLSETEKKQLSILSNYYTDLKDKVSDATSIVDGYENAQSILNSTQEEWVKGTQQATEKQDELAESTSNTNVEFEDSVSTLEELADAQAKAYQEAIAGFSDIQSAYDTLKSASDEYNKTGTYSLETISKLLALNEEYAGALKLVDGQMVVSEEAIRNKVIAQAEEAKQEIYNTALKKLNALASAESGKASTLAGEDHSSATSGIDAETKSLGANTTAKLRNAIADAKGRGASSDDVNKVLKEMSEQLALVNKATISLDTNFEGSMGTAENSTKRATNALKDQKDALNDLKSQYDSAIDYIVSKYDDEIDAIEKAKKVALDAVDARIKAKNREKDNKLKAIDNEINALESERDAREAYWDSVINGLKKVNTERERALALQQAQEAVTSAKSKKVMIFKDKSFGYGINESEVASAEQKLSDLQQDQAYEIQIEKLEALKSAELANYESRLNSLKSYKDSVSASYDEQISNLESYREAVEANYDAQIAYYEMYKEQFIEMTEQYQTSQDGLMASQLAGIDLENKHWMTRLENLNKFVSSYNSLLNRIGSSSSINTSSVQASGKARGYANGIASVPSDQMAVIGDNPSNSELVIGGKLNGVATKLERGSRVVNSTDTRNLLGGLSSMLGYSGLNGQTIGTVSNNNTSTKGVTNNIVVNANVADGEGLVDYLQSFANQMTQEAYAN